MPAAQEWGPIGGQSSTSAGPDGGLSTFVEERLVFVDNLVDEVGDGA
jgi:hypothetical protein